jgi:putative copper resistance protein D
VHLLAASIWVGGLLQLALWPLTVREAGRGDELKRALLRFSTIAQGALLVLLLGGFIVLGDIIGPARDVLQRNWGDFGLMLVIKLALIVAMIIFAALNRFVLLPRLPHDRTTLYRAIGAEALLGCFVILAATALAHSEPPHMHDPGHQTAMALYKGE